MPQPILAVRLWSKVDRSGGPDACWPWLGARTSIRPTRPGYGELLAWGKHAYAHRIAYHLAVGPIPEGMLVCHTCDNGLCCNPAHLFLGTARDNTRDMMAKGRQKFAGLALGRRYWHRP
jgi:HNH endonuclease